MTTKLGGVRSIAARCELVVSPVRTATRTRGAAEPQLGGDLGDLRERAFEVLGDVDGQRLERRHVDHARATPSTVVAVFVGAVETVDAHEEGREGLAGTGGRGDQRVETGGDVGPPLLLRSRGTVGESAPEPFRNGRMESGQGRARMLDRQRDRQEGEGDRGHAPIVADGYDIHQVNAR